MEPGRDVKNTYLGLLPAGYRLRAAQVSDLEGVTALLIAVQVALRGESELNQEEMHSFWQRPGFSLKTDAWVVEGTENGGSRPLVGYEDIAYKPGYTHLRGDGCVHPAYRNLGIGTLLLRSLDTRAREISNQASPYASATLHNVLNANDSEGRSLHMNEGFHPVRYFFRMQIDLDSPPPVPSIPGQFELRQYYPGQEHTLFKTIEEAFQDHWGYAPADYEAFLHDTFRQVDFDPGLIYSVWNGDEMLGCVVCQIRKNRGWIRQLAVRRPWRHQGLGSALTQKAIWELYKRGQRKVALGVDADSETGAPRLYEKTGMKVVNKNIVYEKEIRKPSVE
jgi:mycothiol synthase